MWSRSEPQSEPFVGQARGKWRIKLREIYFEVALDKQGIYAIKKIAF